MRLHDCLLDLVNEGYKLEENEDYPDGITPKELSELSEFDDQAISLFVPADLVPESITSKRIINSGQNLNSKYVIYRRFRHGVGHDSTYG